MCQLRMQRLLQQRLDHESGAMKPQAERKLRIRNDTTRAWDALRDGTRRLRDNGGTISV